MIIGIMSDTHGDAAAVRKAQRAVSDADCWLHAGDYYSDGQYLAEVSGKDVYAVYGNCDGFFKVEPDKLEKCIALAGKKIWLLHGHRYYVKSGTSDLIMEAKAMEIDIVVYGHTHIVDVTQDGNLWVLNPGSASRPRTWTAPPTCMRLEIENGTVAVEIVRLA